MNNSAQSRIKSFQEVKGLKKIFMLLLASVFLVSCSKPTVENTSALDAAMSFTEIAGFDFDNTESLLDINTAERYGINPSDVEEGYVVCSTEDASADKLIIAKGKNVRSTENIEKSLSNVLINLSATYKDNPEESKKIENHLFKTRDKMTILAISEYTDEIEEIFNRLD